jgi:hypothetical protein
MADQNPPDGNGNGNGEKAALAAALLAHVETMSYIQEQTRQQAADLAGGVDPIRVIADDGDAYASALADAMLAEYREKDERRTVDETIAYLGLLGVTADAAGLGALLDGMLEDARASIVAALTAEFQTIREAFARILASGVSRAVALASLTQPASVSAMLASVTSILTNGVADVVKEASRRVQLNAQLALGPERPFRWLTIAATIGSCDDVEENSCAPRHGQVKTLAQWAEAGTPGAPNLVCSIYSKGLFSNCRCSLQPASEPATVLDPVDATEAIKAGKARAQA